MNTDTGALYNSMQDALDAGEKPEKLVEVTGTAEQARALSEKIKFANEVEKMATSLKTKGR